MKRVVSILSLMTVSCGSFGSAETYMAPTNILLSGNQLLASNNTASDESSINLAKDALATQFTFQLKTENLGLWQHGELFARASADYGVDPNELISWSKTADMNRWAGIDTEGATRLDRLVYRQEFDEFHADVSVGLQDFSNAFYRLSATRNFAMTNLQNGPELALPGGMAFANSAVGVKFNLQQDNYYLRAASYDSSSALDTTELSFNVSDGLFTALESGFNSQHDFKIAAGTWNHSAAKELHQQLPQADQKGFYLIAEKRYRDRTSLFVQMGLSESGSEQVSDYRSAGAVISEIFSSDDSLGLAVAKVVKDEGYEAGGSTPSALAWEVTYRTPSLLTTQFETSVYYQYNPNLDTGDNADRVVGLRIFRIIQ
ncbi:carbohydrate porin [Halioxenophilus sp. WMMB6]|uniref:carbohydrate porin n=1 Tax=Halioxenophilus sp. WMMB6 TaxID=3073815 RepID=UPI00295F589A|nr:carbohydrate porin [Halioxenophilus sp. WMMB6]